MIGHAQHTSVNSSDKKFDKQIEIHPNYEITDYDQRRVAKHAKNMREYAAVIQGCERDPRHTERYRRGLDNGTGINIHGDITQQLVCIISTGFVTCFGLVELVTQ